MSQVIAPANCRRIPWEGSVDARQTNILPQHPADQAAWIWSDSWNPAHHQVLRFKRRFRVDRAETLVLHLSADQRYQLYLDGRYVACGPDRSDLVHWAVATYELNLAAGEHTLEALVWWLPQQGNYKDPLVVRAPMAQVSWRGGFLLAAEGAWHEQLSTGVADWEAQDLTAAVDPSRFDIYGYLDIGPSFHFRMQSWHEPEAVAVTIVREAVGEGNHHGVLTPGWQLYPTCLPEQQIAYWSGGVIRTARESFDEAVYRESVNPALAEPFDTLLRSGGSVTVDPGKTLELIWDFQEYFCGYPDIQVEGGRGGTLAFDWAEALFYQTEGQASVEGHQVRHFKKNRNAVERTVFLGIGDSWELDGSAGALPALWWRSGRYVRLRIQTATEPLTLTRLGIRETRYPLELEGDFQCSDRLLEQALAPMRRSVQMCAHEQWIDCPYYEQMSYVGDNVTELAVFTLCRDGRLDRRCIELFDWSRNNSNLVAERYPSQQRQESATYAMLYPVLVYDYARWRDDSGLVHACLPGMRALVEQCLTFIKPDGNVGQIPGWPFVDWIPVWDSGCGPGVREGDASLLNLHLIYCLQHYAGLERYYGEAELAGRVERKATALMDATRERFWCESRGLLADDPALRYFSEHAQCLAILTGLFGEPEAQAVFDSWMSQRVELAPASIYFLHYVLETCYRLRRDEPFFKQLDFWKALQAQGFCTMPEAPEPSRSDCHGWGAHPLYHCFASIAGIRPGAFNYQSVRIEPMPGALAQFTLQTPAPAGIIEMAFDAEAGACTLELPVGLEGEFIWGGTTRKLASGHNDISL